MFLASKVYGAEIYVEETVMYGITLMSRPSDWEIIQQKEGKGSVFLNGKFSVHPAALEVGVERVIPLVRVMSEDDNMAVIPWTNADHFTYNENFQGEFDVTLDIPAGGPYRIDTGLETKSTTPDLTWVYRGDCVLHIGVGNLFIIAGQSNSAGYSRDFCLDPPSMDVHLYRNRSQWDIASHPMNANKYAETCANEEMGVSGVSPYLAFGKKYAQISNMPVGLVQTSLGGSPMARWNPENGDLYQNMIDKIHETGDRCAGILWYQGCSDTDPEPAKEYFEHFYSFVMAVRKELDYQVPFFTMQLNRQINGRNDDCWGMVRDAQARAAREIPGVSVLTTSNLSLCDDIHNTAHANVALGEKLAKQCAFVLNGLEEYQPPEVIKVERVNEDEKEKFQLEGNRIWLKLTCVHVKNCFLLYSTAGKDSGFTLTDSKGNVEILHIRGNRENKNHLYLELAREVEDEAELSFAWQADPIKHPPVDEVTFLPLLSFYKSHINLTINKEFRLDVK